MRKIELKLPESYIPVFKNTIEELKKTSSKIIYLYSPPGYGKTTTLLKFFQETGYNPVFLQLEERDKNMDVFKDSFLEILSEFSGRLKEIISLTNGKTLSASFSRIIEQECNNIVLPDNTYFIFLDTYHLMENFSKVMQEIIIPLFGSMGKFNANVVIEANLPYEFETTDAIIMGTEFFSLTPVEIVKIGDLYGEQLHIETASLIAEKTEGWLLPVILFFKDKRDIEVKLRTLKEWPELLQSLLEDNFKNMNDEEKLILLALGQLKEFSYGAIKWILGYDFPERIINSIKDKGFVVIEEKKKGVLNFRFHRLLKSWLEKKMQKLPMGMEISLRIHAGGVEYFESVGDFENALYHAIRLRDYVRVGKYFKAVVIDLFNEGRISEIETFFEEIGLENISLSYDLTLCYGMYLILIEKYQDGLKHIEKVLENLDIEDRLQAEYYLLLSKQGLGVEDDILIKEADSLLNRLKKYEESPPEKLDFEKDPWRIVKRKVIKSPEYFISLMYGRVYNMLGNLYFSKRKMTEARDFFEKSVECLKKIGDDRRMLTSIHNIGNIELFYGNKEAMEYYNDVVNYPVDFPAKAISLNNIGVCYEIFEGNLDKAEEYYKKALELNKIFSRKDRIITNIANLLYIYAKKKEEEKVNEYLGKLESLIKETQNPRLINSYYIGETEVLIELGRFDKAKESFNKINEIEILKHEQDKYYKIYIEGKLKYVLGYPEEGKELIEESLKWAMKNSSFTDKIEKLYFIYKLYKRFDDKDMYIIRDMADKLVRNKGYLKRLKDFDIKD